MARVAPGTGSVGTATAPHPGAAGAGEGADVVEEEP